ncbi:hypothetical protein L3Q82_020910 [Scortum barcoo]|uniref:Uncharacterized protein n=1 Tax=Scortum barcoo TaxID=214431 RepID=A0ACB8V943_9TELE|nr:hypothetical protein L3Q82_020910 [Scortum barcoo]
MRVANRHEAGKRAVRRKLQNQHFGTKYKKEMYVVLGRNDEGLQMDTEMSALMEDIREAVLAVLPSLPEDKIQSLLNKLASIGVESKSDLQFIKEEDLPANITPIQCQRLLNAWQTQGIC